MRLLADAKDFTVDRRFIGFVTLSVAVLVLVVLPIYLLVSPPEFLFRASAAVMLGASGALIFIVVLALYLQNKGMLFKIPLRFYDEGVQIQPLLSLRPRVIPYEDLSSLEIWYNVGYLRTKSGCSVLSAKAGSVTSVENFPDKETLRKFVDSVKPILEEKGLKMKPPDEEAHSLQFVFHRDLGRRLLF